MGGGKKNKKSKKKKTYTKAQQLAQKRIADKKISTASSTGSGGNNSGVSGVGPVASGSAYAKSLGDKKVTTAPKNKTTTIRKIDPKQFDSRRNETTTTTTPKKTTTIRKIDPKQFDSRRNDTSGVGPVASGAKYASMLSSAPNTGGGGTLLANMGSGEPSPKQARQDAINILKSGINIPSDQRDKLMQQATMKLDTASLSSDPGTLNASLVGGLMAPKSTRFESATGDDSFAQSLGINTDVGGVNYGGLNELRGGSPFVGNANTSRVIRPTGNPNVMSPDGTFNRPGPGGPEPEADYTSYQPGSPFNLSNVNMNATNAGRVLSNVVRAPLRFIGINNNLTDRLYMKDDEAIQDGIDQRGPRAAVARRPSGGGGARLPIAAPTPEEILLPEEVAPTEAPTYQQAGLDNNRLMQIQQEAYRQAYNPMTVGGFNPMFRFFGRRQGPRRGAFRRAFTRAA